MQTTKNTGNLIETYPIKKLLLGADNLKVSGHFFKQLNLVDEKTKVIPVITHGGKFGPTVPTLEGEKASYRPIRQHGSKIKLKRFAEAVELSNQFDMNSVTDNLDGIVRLAMNRITAGIQQEMTTTGVMNNEHTTEDDRAKHFEKLFPAANSVAKTKEGEPLLYSDILSAYNFTTTNTVRDGAFWVFHSDVKLSVLDDAQNERLSFENIPDGAVATLLGLPVYVADIYEYEMKPIAFGIVTPQSYALAMSDVKVYEATLDTPQAIAGSKNYIVEVWADAVITDKWAKMCMAFAPEVKQASVEAQSIDEPKPVKRKATKIEKE
ncbi:hypothetical protein PDK35_10455 [Bacillus cereus group sp. TH153LC]|uniref:hypothetical protein n=1 Tax=Bacillus cereus group sp. TH153LC TaxID=3018059 RepID=UPI0022E25383|nr:hypothetical protein [Bacillus cereus group sp. TH153LC]MDA1660385.1 hypothetical protein [Bacillus cereus group sp. TH153LC]